jgi:hypothetical protein
VHDGDDFPEPAHGDDLPPDPFDDAAVRAVERDEAALHWARLEIDEKRAEVELVAEFDEILAALEEGRPLMVGDGGFNGQAAVDAYLDELQERAAARLAFPATKWWNKK